MHKVTKSSLCHKHPSTREIHYDITALTTISLHARPKIQPLPSPLINITFVLLIQPNKKKSQCQASQILSHNTSIIVLFQTSELSFIKCSVNNSTYQKLYDKPKTQQQLSYLNYVHLKIQGNKILGEKWILCILYLFLKS